jgi:LmbE family N-acetylglucosaminyl deacetylase
MQPSRARRDPRSFDSIVAVGAHLDDIELGCGGTLAAARANGADVHMIVMSRSAYANYDGSTLRTEEQAVAEGQAAAAIIGVTSIDILDFPTKDIPYDVSSVEALNRRFDGLRPDLIITHSPHDTHQSHRAVADATISAGRHYQSILMYEPIFPSGRSYVPFRPQAYVDITDHVDVKEDALRAHRSQWEKYGDSWLEAVRGRSRIRGYDIGTQHAEAFEVVRLEVRV